MNTAMQESDVLAQNDICCPEFDATRWDNKKHQWHEKLFLKDSVPELFHIPLPGTFGKTVTRMWENANKAGALPELKDTFLLAHDPSPFKSELFMPITKEMPGEDTVRLSGTFMSKVFDGPYNKIPSYIKEMDKYLSSQNLTAKKYYFYFAYCPKCSKKIRA
jgi:hypothetical protein